MSLTFADGTNTVVTVPNANLPAAFPGNGASGSFLVFTWSGWLYPTASPAQGTFFNNETPGFASYKFRTNSSRQVLVFLGNSLGVTWQLSSFPSSSALPLNTWSHVAIRCDGANVKIFINGVEDASTAFSTVIGNVANDVLMGNFVDGGFTGSLDDFRMYSRSLSAAEIQTIYTCAGRDGIVNDLQGRWTMIEQSPGSTAGGTGSVKDIAYGKANGTATNSPTYGSSFLRFSKPVG